MTMTLSVRSDNAAMLTHTSSSIQYATDDDKDE